MSESQHDPLLIKLATEALTHQSQGNKSGALVAYKRIQRQFPDFVDAWVNASIVLFEMERIEEALAMAQRAVELDPENLNALHIVANAHYRLGNNDEAAEYFEKFLERDPQCVPALVNLAGIYVHTERREAASEKALAMALRATELDPENPDALCVLANAHQRLENYNDAATNFRKALNCDPTHLPALIGLADMNSNFGYLTESLLLFDRAIQVEPANSEIWIRRGKVKAMLMNLAGAEADLEHSLKLDPNNATVHNLLAHLLLTQCRYREGWAHLNASRDLGLGWVGRFDFDKPHWNGEPLNERTLLVYKHQLHGFGDVIQFSRFFPFMRQQYGCRVLLFVHGQLKRLMTNLPGIDDLITVGGEQLPDFDVVAHLDELCQTVCVDPSKLPPPTNFSPEWPECQPMPELERPGFKIGLIWAGSPNNTRATIRDIAPRFLEELADIPGVAWYGLQKPTPADPPDLPGFIDMSPYMEDFMDTAQIAKQLDLIVTVDTSTAHLAGSLGLPTIVLLPHLPEWRWGLNSSHTPWYPYPDFLLLRQPDHGDWRSVIELLRGRITEFMNR